MTTGEIMRAYKVGWARIAAARDDGFFRVKIGFRSRGYIPKPKPPTPQKRVAWNKGLTNDDPRVKAISDKLSVTLKARFAMGGMSLPVMTPEQRERLSRSQSTRNRGGRSKWFKVPQYPFGEVNVQGTWERDFAQALNANEICWMRPSGVHWQYRRRGVDGEIRIARYTPDFYITGLELYVELKGYWWGRDREKMQDVRESHGRKALIVLDPNAFARVMNHGSLLDALRSEPKWNLA